MLPTTILFILFTGSKHTHEWFLSEETGLTTNEFLVSFCLTHMPQHCTLSSCATNDSDFSEKSLSAYHPHVWYSKHHKFNWIELFFISKQHYFGACTTKDRIIWEDPALMKLQLKYLINCWRSRKIFKHKCTIKLCHTSCRVNLGRVCTQESSMA